MEVVEKLLHAHQQSTQYSALYLKTHKVRNMHMCSFYVRNLIKMGGQHISGYLFVTF